MSIAFIALAATSAHAATSSCGWSKEIFSGKISDKCQKEFEGKLTDEQDKIYSRRMFKDWNVPAETEVYADHGFLEVSNEREQTMFQSQWLQKKPAMMWINGNVVIDDSSDKSIYRRIERMFKKAESMSTASRNPIMNFIMGNEAYAAKTDVTQNLEFLYTVNEFTGSADEVLNEKDSSGAVDMKGGVSSLWASITGAKDQYVCRDNKLGSQDIMIKGKKVTITPLSRTEFQVLGLSDKTILVDMHGEAQHDGEKPIITKKIGRNGKIRYVTHYSKPCQGRSSEKLAGACKDAWGDWIKDHGDKEPEIKSQFEALLAAKGDKADYAHDFSCANLYNADGSHLTSDDRKKIAACNSFFDDRFPKTGLRFGENSAQLKECDGPKCRPITAEEFGKVEDSTLDDSTRAPNPDTVYNLRETYRSALKDASFDADSLCPASYDASAKCDKWSGSPDSKQAIILKRAYNRMQNPLRAEAHNVGEDYRTDLSQRILGMMMLGDCCSDTSCSDKIASKHIELKKDTDTGGAKAR